MRIVLSLEYFDPAKGGQAVWVHGFARYLVDAGHEVHVVARDFAPDGPPVERHQLAGSFWPAVRARRFLPVIRAVGAEACYDTGASYAGGVWMPHAGSDLHALNTLIATEPPTRRVRAALSPRMALLRAQMAWLERMQAARADRIIAVSALVRDLLARRHPAAAGKVVTIGNGTDTAHFSPDAVGHFRATARRDLGIGDRVLFLLAAHNPRLKGWDTALRALGRLIREGAEIHLLAVAGDDEPRWRALAAEHGASAHVTFRGQVRDMRPVYAAADVLLHPTRWDACSLVVLEAMACGLPVITTARNGAADAIRHEESGLIAADPEDAGQLAALMRTTLDAGARARLGGAAREAVRARDIQQNYRAVEDVLRETAARR